MALFQRVTPGLPLSFIPVDLDLFERQLVKGLYVGFCSSLSAKSRRYLLNIE